MNDDRRPEPRPDGTGIELPMLFARRSRSFLRWEHRLPISWTVTDGSSRSHPWRRGSPRPAAGLPGSNSRILTGTGQRHTSADGAACAPAMAAPPREWASTRVYRIRATTLGCESTPKPPEGPRPVVPGARVHDDRVDTATRCRCPAQPTRVGRAPDGTPSQPYPIARTTATAPISRGPTGPTAGVGNAGSAASTCLPFQEIRCTRTRDPGCSGALEPTRRRPRARSSLRHGPGDGTGDCDRR